MMSKTARFLVLLGGIVVAIGQSHHAAAGIITFTDFSDLSDFTLNGETASINTGGTGVSDDSGNTVLRLTNDLHQSGSAFLSDAIPLEDASGFEGSFSTAFEFRFSDQQNAGADGMVFTVQTVADDVGGSGGGIGYKGISNSLGIEFDTFGNFLNPDVDDPSASHVGIDLNGDIKSKATANISSPELDSPNIFWHAWVDYDGPSDLLEVRLNTTNSRPIDPLLSYNVDLVNDALDQPNAFVGFTSGTGNSGADHDIVQWQFTNTLDPISTISLIPEPSSLTLLGLGAVGLLGCGYRRRRRVTKA